MSLQVLKKKSNRYIEKVSGKGNNGFSINGGYRNIGYVGKTNLGKKYCCTNNNNNIIKPSTKNTKGYLYSVVKHPTSVYNNNCSYSNNINFQDKTHYNYSQDRYITDKSVNNSKCVYNNTNNGIANSGISNCCNRNFIGHNNKKTSNYFKDLNTNTSSEYIKFCYN